MNTYKITVTKYFRDWDLDDYVVAAKTEEEAIGNVCQQVEEDHGENYEICLIECIEEDDEEREIMVAIAESNIALDRSGGDYWNFPETDELE